MKSSHAGEYATLYLLILILFFLHWRQKAQIKDLEIRLSPLTAKS